MSDNAGDSKSPSDETPHYHGHRERLRERFRSAGPDALSDYELLEICCSRRSRGATSSRLRKHC